MYLLSSVSIPLELVLQGYMSNSYIRACSNQVKTFRVKSIQQKKCRKMRLLVLVSCLNVIHIGVQPKLVLFVRVHNEDESFTKFPPFTYYIFFMSLKNSGKIKYRHQLEPFPSFMIWSWWCMYLSVREFYFTRHIEIPSLLRRL